MVEKTCSKCGTTKDESEFRRGFLCLLCDSKDHKERYLKNKAAILKRTNDYYHTHKEEYAAKRKAKGATPEGKAKKHADYVNHKDKRLAHQKIYYETHKEERKAVGRKWSTQRGKKLWADAIAFFGPCECCGEDQYELLAIDHRNGNGGWLRKNKGEKTGFALLSRFAREGWPESLKIDYRILCHNCNLALCYRGYCPHERNRENGLPPNYFDILRDNSLIALYGAD